MGVNRVGIDPDYTGDMRFNDSDDSKAKKPLGPVVKKILFTILYGLIFGAVAAGIFLLAMRLTGFTGLRDASEAQEEEQTHEIEFSGEMDEDLTGAADIDDIISADPNADNRPNAANTRFGASAVTSVTTDVTQVVEAQMPSIVAVHNTVHSYRGDSEASGSGIIVGDNDKELLIVTNYHVIEGNDSLEVVFCDSSAAAATVKGTEKDSDLAVIAVEYTQISDDTKNAIIFATIGDSDNLKVGEPVIAIGNSLGYGQSVTVGVVSALNRTIGNAGGSTFIQTDAAINPGNSGGALLNIAGELIGINSNKIGGSSIEGMGYAIPISTAKPIIEDLMLKRTLTPLPRSQQGYLGISGATISASEAAYYGFPEGVYIAKVYDDTPAQEAGFIVGDFIYSVDGDKVKTMDELKAILECCAGGQEVVIKYYALINGQYILKEARVVLAEK